MIKICQFWGNIFVIFWKNVDKFDRFDDCQNYRKLASIWPTLNQHFAYKNHCIYTSSAAQYVKKNHALPCLLKSRRSSHPTALRVSLIRTLSGPFILNYLCHIRLEGRGSYFRQLTNVPFFISKSLRNVMKYLNFLKQLTIWSF